MQRFRHRSVLALLPLLAAAALPALASAAEGWWNPAWTVRKKITLNTGGDGAAITSPTGVTATLIRLHEGNYPFGPTTKEDGADLRFVAEDNKTLLPYHIERWDSVLYEALVWVKTDVKPGATTAFWLYTGNLGDAARADDAKGTWAPDVSAAFHFSENSGSPADSTAAGLTAEGAIIPEPAALIGGGARFTGANQLTIPVAPQLAWAAGGSMTWSAWTRHSVLKPNSVLFSRRDGANALIIGEDNGVPYVQVSTAGGTQRSSGGAPVMANTWRHLAVTANGGVFTVFLDGEQYGTLSAPLPELNSVSILGRDGPGGPADANGFAGEVDELRIHSVALTPGALKFAFANQGPNADASKLLTMGQDESGEASGGGGHSEMLEHVMLFGDIAKNMMFDGWIAVGVCCLMIAVGWTVAVRKFFYINKTQKSDEVFLNEWKKVSSDLTALDHADKTNVKSLGGKSDEDSQEAMEDSPIYHIYHIGSEEIAHRLARDGGKSLGLSARSIQAIRSSLDAGLVREHHRLNNGLVYLTISIAGGPYVGLLGTVVGVMITFAIIAKTGEVEVNSIAPGIASALLATVAGLIVAIPALFIYSYLSNRIKDTVSNMQVFIDEFVAKMAEFYPPASEVNVTRPAHAEAETARR